MSVISVRLACYIAEIPCGSPLHGRAKGGRRLRPPLSRTTNSETRDQYPAAGGGDALHPYFLYRRDDVCRHRDVVELFGHGSALGVGPGEKLQRFGRGRW